MSMLPDFMQDRLGLVAGTAVAAAAASYIWMSSGPQPLETPIPLDQQSVEVEPGVRVSYAFPDGELVRYYYSDAKTTYEAFVRGIRVSNDGPLLGTRSGPNGEFVWQSYQEVYDDALAVASGLVSLGLAPGEDTFIGIYAPNRPEWVICKEACGMMSMVYVPLYDTLGPEACVYIMNQTSMPFVVCDCEKKARALLATAADTPSLKYILVMDSAPGTKYPEADQLGVKVLSYRELLETGKKNMKKPVPPEPSTMVSICYTSGTTGNPKGVMLTHENLMSDTAAVCHLIPDHMAVDSSDKHLSYLPLAHMFEGVVQCMMIQHGARIGFYRGDIKLLMEDLQALKPTIFPTVPRLLNRIYDKVMQGVQGSKLKSMLFNLALNRKMAMVESGIFTKDSIWDKLVFRKIQNLMGGQVRFCVTGSAPLSATVLSFCRCAFGCMVLEGYGQTEATAGVTMTMPNEGAAGAVGGPLACTRIKLVDVPEMEYRAKAGMGEVCVQGPCVMKGYYKEEEKTREVMEGGWLHTGDIGMWLPNGSLKIIDRRKHIFKLAQGEYLAPEKIEGVYIRSPLVAQCFVDGDSLQTFAVGIIVPDPEVLPKWAKNKLNVTGSMETLCKSAEVKKAILDDITKLGKSAGLKGFEQVRNIALYPELFSVENGLLTPTFKAKRPVMRKFFSGQIEDLYKER